MNYEPCHVRMHDGPIKKIMKLLWKYVHNLSGNIHVRGKIYGKLCHYLVHLVNEERLIRIESYFMFPYILLSR
jgi:hypothetical protein